MSNFWETREAAIRRYYGQQPYELHHIWYSPDHDKCLGYEPDDDSYACVSLHSQRTALYGQKDSMIHDTQL